MTRAHDRQKVGVALQADDTRRKWGWHPADDVDCRTLEADIRARRAAPTERATLRSAVQGRRVREARRRSDSSKMADAVGAPAAKAKKKKKVDPFKLQSVQDGGKMTKEEKERYKRYDRGEGNSSKALGNHKLKQSIKRSESKIGASAKAAAQAELLQPTEAGLMEAEGELEYTSRMTQAQIAKAVDLNTACKAYNMTLDRLGPYRISYTADGRRLLLGGRKGHVAVVDWDGSHVGTAGKPGPAQHEKRDTARLHAPRLPNPALS